MLSTSVQYELKTIQRSEAPAAYKNEKTLVLMNYMDIKNPEAGGAEVYCYEIGKRLAKEGYRIIWIARRFKNSKSTENIDGMTVVRLGNQLTIYLHAIIAYTRIRQKSYILDSINCIPFFTPLYSKNKKRIAIIHHIIPLEVLRRKIPMLSPIAYLIQDKIAPILYRNTIMLTNSNSTRVELGRVGYQNTIPVRLGVVLPHGERNKNKKNVVVAVGPIKPWKRLDHAIKAFSYLDDSWTLAIIGRFETEEHRKYLLELAKKLEISDRVNFMGFIDEDKKYALYNEAKIAITASEKEGWGIGLMESQAWGSPVVGYDVSGVRDSVSNGYTGILVPDGDVGALGLALRRLADDGTLLNKYADNAMNRAINYGWDKAYLDFKSVMQSL